MFNGNPGLLPFPGLIQNYGRHPNPQNVPAQQGNPILPLGGQIPIRGRPPNPQNVAAQEVLQANPPIEQGLNRYVQKREFGITIQNFVGRQHDIYLAIGNLVTKCVIGREENDLSDGYHFHIYVYTTRGYATVHELRERFRMRLFPNLPPHVASINIKSLDTNRSVASWKKYCTKADSYALVHNVPLRDCHLYVRTHRFIRSSKVFNELHPFVFEFSITTKHRTEDLISMHRKYWADVALRRKLERHLEQGQHFLTNYIIRGGTWVANLVDWCTALHNLPMQAPIENPKGKCLFLWGLADVGKTRTLENLLPRLVTYAYYPGTVGQFMFSGLRPYHEAIYFSDACPELWQNMPVREMLLRLTESNHISIEVKHHDPLDVEYYGPVLIVSNFEPPPNDGFQRAFHRRFTIIHADVNWSECAERIEIIPDTQPQNIAGNELVIANTPVPAIPENEEPAAENGGGNGLNELLPVANVGIQDGLPVELAPQLGDNGDFDWLDVPFGETQAHNG